MPQPKPGIFVKGELVRHAESPSDAVTAVWEGYKPASDQDSLSDSERDAVAGVKSEEDLPSIGTPPGDDAPSAGGDVPVRSTSRSVATPPGPPSPPPAPPGNTVG